ncbi:DUF2059 domain-containing protein [Sphingomonas sp. MMS12-HWE2-04]|uniref:DUF2059 domain-containing protein n=1 Tax=Sphingomonas sp. MMS12-HWE2-04 TaxID=3234199 RepID=UPI003851139B
MNIVRPFLAAALLLGAAPAFAQSGVTPTATPARGAAQLVALLASDETITRLAGRMFDANLSKTELLPAETRTLFARDPALKQHVAGRTRSALTLIVGRELPSLRTQLSALFAEGMTAQEIAETLTFFNTPTGQKMVAQIYRGVGESGALDERQAEKAAMQALMSSLAPEDYGVMLSFGGTSAAQKLQALDPRIRAISRAWGQDVIARNEARLVHTVRQAVAEYPGKKP